MDITFLGIDPSPSVTMFVEKKWRILFSKRRDIIAHSIIISKPHNSMRKGNGYQVRIKVLLPAEEIVISRETGLNGTGLYTLLTDAFRALLLRLNKRSTSIKRSKRLHEKEIFKDDNLHHFGIWPPPFAS